MLESTKISIREYHKRAWTAVVMKMSLKYDKDILDKLDKVENKADYVRKLIRADIAKEAEKNVSSK